MTQQQMQEFISSISRLIPNHFLTTCFNPMSCEYEVLVLNKDKHLHHTRIFKNTCNDADLQNEIISYIGYVIETHII